MVLGNWHSYFDSGYVSIGDGRSSVAAVPTGYSFVAPPCARGDPLPLNCTAQPASVVGQRARRVHGTGFVQADENSAKSGQPRPPTPEKSPARTMSAINAGQESHTAVIVAGCLAASSETVQQRNTKAALFARMHMRVAHAFRRLAREPRLIVVGDVVGLLIEQIEHVQSQLDIGPELIAHLRIE